jgi:Protein of unknown function (DUF2778)
LRVASLDAEAAFDYATADRQSTPTGGPSSADEILQSGARRASFAERFAGAIDWPSSRPSAETQARVNDVLSPATDQGRRAAAPHAVSQPARASVPLPALPPAAVAKKQIRVADAAEDAIPPPDTDGHTAIYDISAHKVYLPSGRTLEAHSGYGSYLDDPRYVSEKDRGATPPNVYDLSLREEPFHGVRAIRLSPAGGGNMYGRDGLLAHTYMLGPNGQSNGCVSISDYSAFLDAYTGGEITRLVVVDHLATPPSRTASRGLVETIKALFGRS